MATAFEAGAEREKIRGFPQTPKEDLIMEAERINLIGSTLADLSVRTVDLRRYL
jgi:hypothetical protein